MHPYPHTYLTDAAGSAAGAVSVSAVGLPALPTAAPPQFDGPGDLWSPEYLLCAALASCFILTFRALSRAARLPWEQLQCTVQGTLERVEGSAQFSSFSTQARLTVPVGTDQDRAHKLLEQAEHGCLIANSLRGQRRLDASVVLSGAAGAPAPGPA